MTIGIVGRKSGMTRIFTDEGLSIPVTVVEAAPNRITQVKSVDSDGYDAVQVTIGSRRSSRVNKPGAGHFAKAEVEAGSTVCELRNAGGESFEVGGQLTVEAFAEGQIVDVTGTSKGKGFAGGVKRWNFKMQDATHGNSLSHRAPGSIGASSWPSRVFKGMRMAGRDGGQTVTIENLLIIKIVPEKNLIVVKGSVPGAKGSYLTIRKQWN